MWEDIKSFFKNSFKWIIKLALGLIGLGYLIYFLAVQYEDYQAKLDEDQEICVIDLSNVPNGSETEFHYDFQIALATVWGGCWENSILLVRGIDVVEDPARYQNLVARYCRFDRNVIETDVGFTCVLYDPLARNITAERYLYGEMAD